MTKRLTGFDGIIVSKTEEGLIALEQTNWDGNTGTITIPVQQLDLLIAMMKEVAET